MKKNRIALVVSIVALSLFCFGVWGCGPSSTPTDSATKALEALKAQDVDTLAKYYAGDVSALTNPEQAIKDAGNEASGMATQLENLTDEQKAKLEQITSKILSFDYTVSNEQVVESKATVDVEITTYDFGQMIQETIGELISQAFAAAFTGDTDTAAQTDAAITTIATKVDALSEKTKTTKVTVPLTKGEDGVWKVDDLSKNVEFTDALFGGMISSLKDTVNSITSAFGGGVDSEDAGAADDTAEAADGATNAETAASDSAAVPEAA